MIRQQHDQWQRERLLEALDAHRRGIGEAPLLRKWSGTPEDAAASGQSQKRGEPMAPMAFVISTDEVDHHGDVIAADGWNLESYRKNPVFLWAHDYARPVIGKAVDIWKEPHSLMAKIQFAPTEFAREVAGLYESGYQRGVSVGFKPIRYEERRHEKTGAFLGIRFLEQELLEASAVPVPANRNALRRALELAPRLKEYLGGFENKAGSWDGPPARPADATPAGRDSQERPDLNMAGLAVLDAIWPRLSAQVDELAKLVEELAEMVEGTALGSSRGSSPADFTASEAFGRMDVELVLSAIRGATVPVTAGSGGGPVIRRR